MTKTNILFHLFVFACFGACNIQQSNNKMSNNNPLLCNPETGVCEIPNASTIDNTAIVTTTHKPIKVIYYTDPICSSCWGIEPQLRKLKLTYGNTVSIEYRMGGLLPDWSYNSGGISKPADVAHHWDEVSQYYQMPIDGDVWLEDPLPSSYPPSIAFKAAQMQDESKAVHFLRKIREMVFLQKKNITKWEHIKMAAQYVGLDTLKLKYDFDNEAKEHFKNDLELARKMGVRGFPTLFFVDSLNKQEIVYGFKAYPIFEAAVLKLHPKATKQTYATDWGTLFEHYETLTTKEYAELSGSNFTESEKNLQDLFSRKKLQKFSTKNGAIWTKTK